MKNIGIELTENKPHLIDLDGAKFPIDAFLLITNISTEGVPMGNFIAFGSSEKIGRMVYNFWQNAVKTDEEIAFVLECVANDIITKAKEIRGAAWTEPSGAVN